jgi:RNA polymerase sigma-70 factor, ECF subfamily
VSKYLVGHALRLGASGGKQNGMSDFAQSLPWGRDESELVTELQAGSDAAFDWLVTYYHAGVYNLVYGILSDSADAADVTQEVFLRAFRGIRGFRQGSSLKTWLYRISVRQALNHRRWCWRHHRQQVSIDAEEEGRNPALDLKDSEASPLEQCETHEMQATVRRALSQIPDAFRGAVILRDLEGLSYEEVAEVLEVSVGTVKSRILRGRRLLKDILNPLVRVPERTPSGSASTSPEQASLSYPASSELHPHQHPSPSAATAAPSLSPLPANVAARSLRGLR